jgi:hypothetical protein
MSDTHEGETADGPAESDAEQAGESDTETDVDADAASSKTGSAVAGAGDELDTVEKEQPASQHTDRRLAIIVALVGIVGVLLGVAGTLIGVFLNISAAKEQSTEEFRRDQRKVEYPRILSFATDLKNATEVAGADLGILGGLGFDFNAEYYSKSYPPAGYNLGAGNDVEGLSTYKAYPYSSVGSVRGDWQSAYAKLDQAIAEAQIAGTPEVLGIARALRDSYREQYAASLADQLDAINEASYATSKALWENAPTGQRSPEPPKAPRKIADLSEDERAAELNQFIGVGEPNTASLGYNSGLASKSSCELMAKYVIAARDDLDLDDELLMYTCAS